ncbi:unnamed protein product [Rotaria sp. Silwood1]|nr:unnamed protein product [Rotaria sp. Silwood1]CAF4843339.1 unnamed protein product [Rotaria sp. Silwood1]
MDIISINETNLHEKTQFQLPGFNVFRFDRSVKKGGGVLLAIRKEMQCYEILSQNIDDNECVAVQISTKSGPLLICSLYIPPRIKISSRLFDQLLNINANCLIMGDLNAASTILGSRKTNNKGIQLQELLNNTGFSCIDDNITTYERNQYEEKLDWILATRPIIFCINNVNTHMPLGTVSGHKPLTFNLMTMPDDKPPSPRIQFSFNLANWSLYRHVLNEKLMQWDMNHKLVSANDIDEYANFISESIVAAARSAIPQSSGKIKIEISPVTKHLINLKHQFYRSWKQHGIGKSQYYRTREQLTLSLRNDRIARLKKICHTLTTKQMNTGKVWALIRKYHNKRTKQKITSVLKYQQMKANSDLEKVNMFATYFENDVYPSTPDTSAFHVHISEVVKKIKKSINNSSINSPSINSQDFQVITPKELKSILKQLPNSAPGPDNVHNRCLKNFTKSLIDHLLNLMNTSLSFGYIPSSWKNAFIILLLKPGKDRTQVSSYRPISLLSCVGKVLEKIIKQRLSTELKQRNILPRHQAGFLEGKSTMYNILRLNRCARQALDRNHHAGVIFFDIKSAFDSVWHDGLIYKMNDFRLPVYLIRWTISFLYRRTAQVELENQLSHSFEIKSGTPQGSPLSPLLYILFTSDSMNSMPFKVEYGLFADDTAIFTSSNTTSRVRDRLQESINQFIKWCDSWKLVIQPTKTELIHFSPHPRKKYPNPIHLRVSNIGLRPQPSARYLGIIFDKQLHWKEHVKNIEARTQSRINLLRYLNKITPDSNEKIMLNIYKSLIRPILTYGSSILLRAEDKIWNRLQIVQNKSLRAALNLPHFTSATYIHQITNIPYIRSYATVLTERALTRSQQMEDTVTEQNIISLLN